LSGFARGEELNIMTVDDRTRLNLHRKLEAVLGPEEANTLMAHLPPDTWQDVATTKDLAALETAVRSEIAVFRAEMRGELADVRGEMRAGFAEVRSETHRSMVEQTRWFIGCNFALAAVVLTVARLIL
jgi:hypothetical protein